MTTTPYRDLVEFGVLGSLEVRGPTGRIELRGSRERLLLAHLLAAAGQVVPVTTLIDGLWGEDPPRTAGKALQNIVLRVRRALDPHRAGPSRLIVTEPGGYRLVTEALHVDSHRFEALVRAATSLEPAARAATLKEALELWRGEAFSGLTEAPAVASEARRLTELRVAALEDWCEAELEAGHRTELVAELEGLVVEHPLREQMWALLIRALYQQGRQGEALGAFARARAVLADELGVEPGPALQQLHARILSQDPRLVQARSSVPPELVRTGGALVGRDREMAVLRDLWDRTRRGATSRVLLRAPSGAGARRLAAELAAEVCGSGGEVVYVGGTGDGSDVPRSTHPLLVVVACDVEEPELDGRPALVLSLARPSAQASAGALVLDLGPLDVDEIRRVVAPVVPGPLVEDVLSEVWPDSAGWPGRAHRLATSALRRLVSEEVRSAAARAGSAATVLGEARSAVSAGVLYLGDPVRGADETERGRDVAPWPGLPAYGLAEAQWFAGRERLVAEMVARLPGSSCLAVVGASGSGKSSAVGSGLLAALAAGRLPGSGTWRALTMRPGSRPMGELARTLLAAGPPDVGELLEQLLRAPEGGADRRVLVVDQFEECWTECHDAVERDGFLDVLSGLAADPSSRTTLVVVVRADFLPRVAEHRAMSAALADSTVLVGTPSPDEVRRAVVVPSQRAGLVLEEGLVDAIVGDAGREPGLLPLLSTTMRRLWDERQGRVLTLGAYVTGGGLRGAIARLAEAEYSALGPAQQQEARLVLLRLAGSGDGDEVVRRRVRLDELRGLSRDVVPLLDLLAEARLVTVSDGYVEVAHEALFREWPRLQGWLGEDREGRGLQRRLASAATEWHDEKRDPTLLWTGARLETALGVARERPDELTDVEHAFLAAARDAAEARSQDAERRVAEKARQNRRLRLLLLCTATGLVVALVAGLLALRARGREADAARTASAAVVSADAKRLAASALSMEQPDLALLTAVEATRLEPGSETHGAVLTLLGRHPDVVTRVSAGPDSSFMTAAADPGGGAVYLGQEAPELWAVDPDTGARLWTHDLDAMGLSVSASPDGGRVAVLVVDRSGQPEDHVVVLGRDGEELWRLSLDQINRWTGTPDPFIWENPTWRRDGTLVLATDTYVVTVDRNGYFQESVPWGRPVDNTATFVAWPDGRVSTGSSDAGPGVVLDLSRSRSRTVPDGATIWAASPDGDVVAATRPAESGTELVTLEARTLRASGPAWPLDGVTSFMRFSPDGSRLIAAVDERIEVRESRSGALLSELTGLSSDAMGADWVGPDRLWTAGREGTAVAFDVSGEHGVIASSPSPDLPWAGEGAADADVQIWSNRDDFGPDAAFLRRVRDRRGVRLPLTGLEGCQCEVTSTDVTADGSTALAGVRVLGPDGSEVPDRGHVVVWDVASRRVRSVVDTPWPVQGLDSAPRGDAAVLNGGAGWGVLDLVGMRVGDTSPLPSWTRFGWGTSLVEVSPDGTRAALLRGPRVLVVEVGSGEVLHEAVVDPDPEGSLISAAWSVDGETLAIGSVSGRFSVVSGRTLERVAPPRLLTGGPVGDIEVSPDGRVAASIEGADGDVVLWDTSTWSPYGQAVLRDEGGGFLHFEPDSSHLEVVHGRGVRARVAAQPVAWVRAACAAANRALTADEMAVLDVDPPPGPTCPGPMTGG